MITDFLKKNWLAISLIIAAVLLGGVLFSKCAPDNTHKDEKKAVDSTANYWQVKVKEVNKNYDSILSLNQKYEAAITELATKVWAKQVLANANQQRINELVAQYKTEHNAPAKIQICDSLIDVVQAKDFQIQGMTELTDSIIANHNAESANWFALELKQKFTITAQEGVIEDTRKKYDGLYKDYDKSVRANKFNKTLNRILAGALLVVGGALIFK